MTCLSIGSKPFQASLESDQRRKREEAEKKFLAAAEEGAIDGLRIMLSEGFNPVCKNPQGETAMTIALAKAHIHVVQELFRLSPQFICQKMASILKSFPMDVLGIIKSYVCPIDLFEESGPERNIFSKAVQKDDEEIVKAFLAAGASPMSLMLWENRQITVLQFVCLPDAMLRLNVDRFIMNYDPSPVVGLVKAAAMN